MSKFVKTVQEANQIIIEAGREFKKELPNILKNAYEKSPNCCILEKRETNEPGDTYEDTYTVGTGYILHKSLAHGTRPERTYGPDFTKLSYEEFIANLTPEDLLYVAKSLMKLGF